MNYNNDCHHNHHNDEQQQLDSSSPGNTPTPTGCTSPGPMMEVVRVKINIMIIMNHHTDAGCLHWDIFLTMVIIIRRRRSGRCCRSRGHRCSSWWDKSILIMNDDSDGGKQFQMISISNQRLFSNWPLWRRGKPRRRSRWRSTPCSPSLLQIHHAIIIVMKIIKTIFPAQEQMDLGGSSPAGTPTPGSPSSTPPPLCLR